MTKPKTRYMKWYAYHSKPDGKPQAAIHRQRSPLYSFSRKTLKNNPAHSIKPLVFLNEK